MHHSEKANTIGTGLALFCMFFGAGNLVFPLALGQYAQLSNFWAILGMFITAVCVPFLGVIAITFYDGDYRQFFGRLGKLPGFLVALFIMTLIGPFGAIPRCLALSYGTTKISFPNLAIEWYMLVSVIVVFLVAYRKGSLLELIGYYLTPILLFLLGLIIVMGFFTGSELPTQSHNSLDIFLHGFKEGYQTMDLLGAFFFSGVVMACLHQDVDTSNPQNYKVLFRIMLKASAIGAILLSAIYVGFSYVAAFNSAPLEGLQAQQMIGAIAFHVLGPYAGVVICLAVALTCFTTAIPLASVFAEFMQKNVLNDKLGYGPCLAITCVLAYFFSIQDFSWIVKFLFPILEVIYPGLIVLSIANLSYKLYNFKPVKVPVAITFALTAAYYWL